VAGPTYHTYSPWGAHDLRAFGLTCATTLVPGISKGVWLKSNCPNSWVAADIGGLMQDVRMSFKVSMACGRSSHHKYMGNFLSTENSPATK
jgi:hypothetical protein